MMGGNRRRNLTLHKTTLFIVRHGQTEWNKQNRLQGHKNSPLTEIGKQQALEVKKSLDRYEIHKAYVSPLQRAQETLEIILDDREVEIVISNNLKEINLGPWEEKTKEETKKSHPAEYAMFWENQNRFFLPKAETYQQLQNRAVEEIETIFSKNKGKNILVVSHWIAIKVVIAHYTSTPLNKLSCISDPKNGAFFTLIRHGNNTLIKGL